MAVRYVTSIKHSGFGGGLPYHRRVRTTDTNALEERLLRPFLRRKRRRETLEPPPLARWLTETLDLATTLLPCSAGSVLLDDPTRKQDGPLTFVAAFGPESERLVGMEIPKHQGIAGRVYTSGRVCIVDAVSDHPDFYAAIDTELNTQTLNMVAAPIRLEQNVCGVLEIMNCEPSFTKRDATLVSLLAEHLSRAIINGVDVLKHNYLALHDDLTGVRNARGLDDAIQTMVNRSHRNQEAASMLFVDVDHLKHVNDTHGHRTGSEVLRGLGQLLSSLVPNPSGVFRFGGDEFVVLCPKMNAGDAMNLAEKIVFAVRERDRQRLDLPRVTVSIGISTLGSHSTGPQLLSASDKALYEAKSNGRDRIEAIQL